MSPEKSEVEMEKEIETSSEDKKVEAVVSKQSFRIKVWDDLKNNNLVLYPRPAYGRIPNFKGAAQATARLAELEVFRAASSIEVNPDKTLEGCRVLAVESDKTLYVPIPRLEDGLLKKLSFCAEDRPKNVQQAVTRWGVETLGKSVDFSDPIHIEVFILGSVAVSRTGRRIGKGKGFADLEYAILREMGAVNDETVVVTIVHESQVFDDLPDEIFDKFDVPIDFILTPSEVIEVGKRLPRPEGIYWGLLSQRRVDLMPILQKIKKMHESADRDTTLNEVNTDVEMDEKRKLQRRKRRYLKRKPKKSDTESSQTGASNKENAPLPRKKQPHRRTPRALKERLTENQEEAEGEARGDAKERKPRSARKWSRRLQVDFSLMVSNIDKNVRVRHLKNALIDRGIKPSNITWRGYKGFCYLHYAKPAPKKLEEEKVEVAALVVDNVIEILQGLKLNPESESNLSVKVVEPVTRVETTDVTSV